MKTLSPLPPSRRRHPRSGQVMIMFAILSLVLCLFAAMSVDFGLIYMKKARLSRAMDSVALRLANDLPTDLEERAGRALKIMQANYPGFLSGVDYDEDAGITPESAIQYYTSDTDSDVIEITQDHDTLLIDSEYILNEEVTPPLKIASVDVQCQTRHDTTFLRLAQIDNIDLAESAAAQRVPSIVVLIIDVSGSMGSGNPKGSEVMPKGVQAFLEAFENNQEQDYLALVTFSWYARCVWPDHYEDGTSPMVASNNFVAPVNDFLTNGITYSGFTCAQEGMRLAYTIVNNTLGSIPDDDLRDQLKVYYVFFTDGAFNTCRAYVQGTGYDVAHSADTAPWFHKQLPVAVDGDDYSPYQNVLVANSTNAGFSTTSYNLNSTNRFGNYSGTNNITPQIIRGISATFPDGNAPTLKLGRGQGTTPLFNVPAGDEDIYGTVDEGDVNDSSIYLPDGLYNERYWYAGSGGPDFDYYANWTNVILDSSSNVYNPTGGTEFENREKMWWVALGEVWRQGVSTMPSFPVYVDYDARLATQAGSYPALAREDGMDADDFNRWPEGRYYANSYDSKPNYSCRMSDFYPDFTYGDHPTNILNYTNSITTPPSMHAVMYTNGAFTSMYSFKYGDYKPMKTVNDSSWREWREKDNMIDEEGYWVSMMQCWVARTEQNAKVYVVNFSSTGGKLEKRQMANDRTGDNGEGINPFFDDQPAGAFYHTTDEDTMTAAFRDIAQKIGTHLTR